jgi:hypothetical protein
VDLIVLERRGRPEAEPMVAAVHVGVGTRVLVRESGGTLADGQEERKIMRAL